MEKRLMNPCIDYCFLRFGKQYNTSCDKECEYAKVVKENRELKAKLELGLIREMEAKAYEEYDRGRTKEYI